MLVGSSPNRVGDALSVLEGTFVRRSPKPGSLDDQEYWSFRHPTLREGFATFIGSNPSMLKVLIEGLDEEGGAPRQIWRLFLAECDYATSVSGGM